ncbi:aldehyde dehydrogenase family protein [Cupriavidus basilensis]
MSAILITEVLHEAELPRGVFNLVNGDGSTVGNAMSTHADVDMVSFTGSTRAGILRGTGGGCDCQARLPGTRW